MKFINKRTLFLVLFSVLCGFILGQNYDIGKSYFNFGFLRATVSPNSPSLLEEPELNFSEINLETSLPEGEKLAPADEEVGEIGQELGFNSQPTLVEIQEILDDIGEQIDVMNQEIAKLTREIQEFSEQEAGIEEEMLPEEEPREETEKEGGEEGICPGGIDINTASKEELDKIMGVGSVIAQRIIDARPFSSIYDLTGVAGIGGITLQKIIEQACAYIKGDTGRPSGPEPVSFSGGSSSGTSPAPTAKIDLSFPSENPANEDIEAILSLSGLKSATYDVKISILEISEQSEQKRTLSEIYDGEKWSSSYNYVLKVFSGTSFEGNFKLRIKQDKQNFRGEADIIVKIRDSEKQKIQAQWQGKINITEPEEEPREEEQQEEENGEKIFFEIFPTSLSFKTNYGEIPESQLLCVSGLVDGVYISSLINGLIFPSWIIVEPEQDNFKVSIDVSGKNPGTYEDIIEINYSGQSYSGQSEKIPVSLEILINVSIENIPEIMAKDEIISLKVKVSGIFEEQEMRIGLSAESDEDYPPSYVSLNQENWQWSRDYFKIIPEDGIWEGMVYLKLNSKSTRYINIKSSVILTSRLRIDGKTQDWNSHGTIIISEE